MIYRYNLYMCDRQSNLLWSKRIVRSNAPFQSIHVHQFSLDSATWGTSAASDECLSFVVGHSNRSIMRIWRGTSWLIQISIETGKNIGELKDLWKLTCGILVYWCCRNTEAQLDLVRWNCCTRHNISRKSYQFDALVYNRRFYLPWNIN